jgi:hypothetical protein
MSSARSTRRHLGTDQWDLTAYDPQRQGKLPYAIPFATITAISESPFKFGVLYAGTDDGRVLMTRTARQLDGDHRRPPLRQARLDDRRSKYEPATVYIALIGRHDDDFAPYVYKSSITGRRGRASRPISRRPVNIIREDPRKDGVLYAPRSGGLRQYGGAKSWNYWAPACRTCRSGTSRSIRATT